MDCKASEHLPPCFLPLLRPSMGWQPHQCNLSAVQQKQCGIYANPISPPAQDDPGILQLDTTEPLQMRQTLEALEGRTPVLLVAPHHGIDCCKCGRTAAVFRKAGCMEDRAQNGTCGEASRSCTLRSLKVKLSWPARVAKTGRPVTRLQPCMATGRWHKTRLIADGSSGVALTPAWKLVARDATCALDPAQIEFALLSWPLLLDQKPHFLS